MTTCAITTYKALNGIFSVYKPPCLGPRTLLQTIRKVLAGELNEMEVRPVSSRVVIDGYLSKGEDLTVKTVTNYADHPLVVGPRYQIKDIKLFSVNNLDWFSSGVFPIGIGSSGCYHAKKLQNQNCIRSYEVTGRLGYATDDFSSQGKVREKSTYDHVTRGRLEAFLAKMESNHQTFMFSTAGVDINSQEAYDLASKGLIRPAHRRSMPVIYSIKCLEYKPPFFLLELQCVNEWPVYLKRMVHDIGLGLKTNATCTRLRCTRFGKYTVDDSLLMFHVKLQNVINMLEYFDPAQRKLVRPVIEDSSDDDFSYYSDQEDEPMDDIMTFRFEKDADGYVDDGSDFAAQDTM